MFGEVRRKETTWSLINRVQGSIKSAKKIAPEG